MNQLLSQVGPRLRAVRESRNLSLADVSAESGISSSTLSRLESGQRKPQLELLLPLARIYGLPLDDLVGAPETGDPRVHLKPIRHGDQMIVPLSRVPGGIRAYKHVFGHGELRIQPELRIHEGYEWIYVLSGKLRVVLGEHDFVLTAGEVAEFDTRTPHWFGKADHNPVEYLGLFGPQGERMHVRASQSKV